MRHYSQRLEQDLYHIASSAERYQISLGESQQRQGDAEDKLAEERVQHASSRSELAEERLEHAASRTELDYERQRHRETEKLSDLSYKLAEESFALSTNLRTQIAELQSALFNSQSATDFPVQ